MVPDNTLPEVEAHKVIEQKLGAAAGISSACLLFTTLYALFDFFELSSQLISEGISRLGTYDVPPNILVRPQLSSLLMGNINE